MDQNIQTRRVGEKIFRHTKETQIRPKDGRKKFPAHERKGVGGKKRSDAISGIRKKVLVIKPILNFSVIKGQVRKIRVILSTEYLIIDKFL